MTRKVDAIGNLTKAGGVNLPTSTSTNHLDWAATRAVYDGAGNLTAYGLSLSTTTYTYTLFNQLGSVWGPFINRSQAYTADGERIFVRDGSTYLFTLRDLGGNVIREYEYSYSGGWRWRRDNIYRGGLLLASETRGEGIRHYTLDHLGSPRLVTNRTGEKLTLFATSPFGKDPTATQSTERMRFTVHERDLGSLSDTLDDIDSMHARSYRPMLGRFTSIDPVRGNPGSPQSWNLYAYVQNNPLNRTDPDGKKDRRSVGERVVLEDPDVLRAMGEVIEKTHYENPLQDRNEMGTVIVETGPNDYDATQVKTGSLTRVILEPVVDGRLVSNGQTAMGAVHSHAGTGQVKLDGKNVRLEAGRSSDGDRRNAAMRGLPSYIIDSNRALIRYDPKTGKDVRILTGKDYRAYRDRALETLKPAPDNY